MNMKKKILSILLCAVFTTSLIMGCAKNGGNSSSSASEEIEAEGGRSINKNATCITPLNIIKSKEPSIWFYSRDAERITKDTFPFGVYIFQNGYLTKYWYEPLEVKGSEETVWKKCANEVNWPTYGELSKMSTKEMIKHYESMDCYEENTGGDQGKKISKGKEKQKYSVYGISDGAGNELQYEILGYKGEPPKIEGFEFPNPYYQGIFLRASSEQVFPIYDATFVGFRVYDQDARDQNYEGDYFLTKESDVNVFTAMDELGVKGMEVDPEDYEFPYSNYVGKGQ